MEYLLDLVQLMLVYVVSYAIIYYCGRWFIKLEDEK